MAPEAAPPVIRSFGRRWVLFAMRFSEIKENPRVMGQLGGRAKCCKLQATRDERREASYDLRAGVQPRSPLPDAAGRRTLECSHSHTYCNFGTWS